jgi:hypothetical protein
MASGWRSGRPDRAVFPLNLPHLTRRDAPHADLPGTDHIQGGPKLKVRPDDYANINAWWRQQFPDVSTAPARFTFQAGALPFGAKIEIQAVAARGY